MNNQGDATMDRRHFIMKGGAATTITIGAVSSLQAQSATRLAQGAKPPLTQRSLDAMLSIRPEQRAALAAEARRDLRAFVRNRFSLGETQAKILESMSSSQIEMINRQLAVAEASGGNFAARLMRPNNGSDVPPPARKCEGLEISITFTF